MHWSLSKTNLNEVGSGKGTESPLALLLALRGWQRYPGVVLKGGSVAAIAISSIWFIERTFDATLLPF